MEVTHHRLEYVLTQGVFQLQLVMLVHFVCIERDKWGIDPGLILEGTMYNLTLVRSALNS